MKGNADVLKHLNEALTNELKRSSRNGRPLSVMMFDIDQFKSVNDRHGHPAGDVVLREIGRVLPMALRPSDVVCRYGGEEFCIVLPDADGPGAEKALSSLAARLRDLRVEWQGRTLGGFTFSAGALDYLVNFGQATRPLWLIPIGLGYAVVYYVVFRFVIRRWNLRTPGRELENDTEATEAVESPKAA